MTRPLTAHRLSGLRRIVRALLNSLEGLNTVFRNEAAFRQEIYLSLVLLPVALWVDVGKVERLFLVTSLLLVPMVELLNSGIELAIDRISLENHPLSKAAKDVGSAAVLVALIYAVVVWCVVLWQ